MNSKPYKPAATCGSDGGPGARSCMKHRRLFAACITDQTNSNGSFMRTLIRTLLLAGFFFVPTIAHAHSTGVAANGWNDGFNHPLHGWDHLLVMIAVGLWAAQQRGHAVW